MIKAMKGQGKITKGMLGLEIIKRYFEFNYFKKNRLPKFKTKEELVTYIKRYYIDETIVTDDSNILNFFTR